MSNINTLKPADRVRAMLALKTGSTPATKTQLLAEPGQTGNDPTPTPTLVSSRAPKGWEPRVTYAPNGTPQSIFSPALPENVGEQKALQETLTILKALVPPGYTARLAEVRLDEGAWSRKMNDDGVGTGDAYTVPTRRYRWVVEPEATLDARIGSLTETDWHAAVNAIADRKYPPLKLIENPEAVDLVVPVGDLQAGQHDGDGVDGLIARMSLYPLYVKAELERLKAQKVTVKRLVIPFLGDLVEGILGFYANQTWVVTLNRRDQTKIVRRLAHRMIEELAQLGLPILCVVVPGNHGQNRSNKGKIVTDLQDNEDIAIMEIVAELCQANPHLKEQITFHFTKGHEQSVTIDLGWGYTVAFAHGHMGAIGGAGAASKQQNYLARQALAEQAVGRAKYYITGHYHSAMYVTLPGNKTWIQIPALCDNSEFFLEEFGLNGGPGLLTWTFGPEGLDQWRHHKVPTLSELADLLGVEEASV